MPSPLGTDSRIGTKRREGVERKPEWLSDPERDRAAARQVALLGDGRGRKFSYILSFCMKPIRIKSRQPVRNCPLFNRYIDKL